MEWKDQWAYQNEIANKLNTNKHIRYFLLVPVILLVFSCHNDDDFRKESCLPSYLHSNTDSIVFQYDGNRKPISTLYYFSSQYLTGSNEFEYNNKGQLITLRNYNHRIFTNEITLNSTYTLEYSDKGLPSILHSTRSSLGNTEIRTEFIHDDKNRLTSAAIYLVTQNSTYESVGYRYEYDNKDNVVKVYYKVRLNNNQTLTEVLARENSRFDDSPAFYKYSEGLRIANVYVYNYVPSANNCLAAKVYYPDYKSHFVTPQEFEFTSTYDQNGLITQLIDPSYRAQLYLDEAFFSNASYQCR